MLIAKKFNSKILKWLSIAFFVMTLIVYPSLWSFKLPFLGSSASVEVSVNAQAAEPESGQRDIKFDIAQAPAASEGGEEAEEQEEVINFFAMAMGALAGLVLFIYGVTRLSEGLASSASALPTALRQC